MKSLFIVSIALVLTACATNNPKAPLIGVEYVPSTSSSIYVYRTGGFALMGVAATLKLNDISFAKLSTKEFAQFSPPQGMYKISVIGRYVASDINVNVVSGEDIYLVVSPNSAVYGAVLVAPIVGTQIPGFLIRKADREEYMALSKTAKRTNNIKITHSR